MHFTRACECDFNQITTATLNCEPLNESFKLRKLSSANLYIACRILVIVSNWIEKDIQRSCLQTQMIEMCFHKFCSCFLSFSSWIHQFCPLFNAFVLNNMLYKSLNSNFFGATDKVTITSTKIRKFENFRRQQTYTNVQYFICLVLKWDNGIAK